MTTPCFYIIRFDFCFLAGLWRRGEGAANYDVRQTEPKLAPHKQIKRELDKMTNSRGLQLYRGRLLPVLTPVKSSIGCWNLSQNGVPCTLDEGLVSTPQRRRLYIVTEAAEVARCMQQIL